MIGLAFAFFATALLYSIAGFGGGSTYNALLILAGTDFRAVPVVALACNIVVVCMGSWRFTQARAIRWRRVWPLFAFSIPASWIGGRLAVAELLFVGLLSLSLFAAGTLMLWQPKWRLESAPSTHSRWVEPAAGAGLGFLAGVVGIGGGIFLAPLLYLLRWGPPRAIAGTSAAFILVNSIAGLAGQLAKGSGSVAEAAFVAHWPLFPAVLIGGLAGSTFGSGRLDARYLRIVTAILILYVAVRLAIRFYGEAFGAGA